jgi:hypothetical protein
MIDRATISALNELADTLNEAAAKLDATSPSANGLVPHVEPVRPSHAWSSMRKFRCNDAGAGEPARWTPPKL